MQYGRSSGLSPAFRPSRLAGSGCCGKSPDCPDSLREKPRQGKDVHSNGYCSGFAPDSLLSRKRHRIASQKYENFNDYPQNTHYYFQPFRRKAKLISVKR